VARLEPAADAEEGDEDGQRVGEPSEGTRELHRVDQQRVEQEHEQHTHCDGTHHQRPLGDEERRTATNQSERTGEGRRG
jgi:hypothetical protein